VLFDQVLIISFGGLESPLSEVKGSPSRVRRVRLRVQTNNRVIVIAGRVQPVENRVQRGPLVVIGGCLGFLLYVGLGARRDRS